MSGHNTMKDLLETVAKALELLSVPKVDGTSEPLKHYRRHYDLEAGGTSVLTNGFSLFVLSSGDTGKQRPDVQLHARHRMMIKIGRQSLGQDAFAELLILGAREEAVIGWLIDSSNTPGWEGAWQSTTRQQNMEKTVTYSTIIIEFTGFWQFRP